MNGAYRHSWLDEALAHDSRSRHSDHPTVYGHEVVEDMSVAEEPTTKMRDEECEGRVKWVALEGGVTGESGHWGDLNVRGATALNKWEQIISIDQELT